MSDILKTVHSTAEGLQQQDAIDKETMDQFDDLCIPTWQESADATNRLFNHFQRNANAPDVENAVKSIYQNALPKAILDVLSLMYVYDYNRDDNDAVIVVAAYKQFITKGSL